MLILYLAQCKISTQSTLGPSWLVVKLSSGLYGQYFPGIAHLLSSVFTRMEHLAQAGFHGGQCQKSTRCTRELNCSHRVQGNCESKIARFLDAFFFRSCNWIL